MLLFNTHAASGFNVNGPARLYAAHIRRGAHRRPLPDAGTLTRRTRDWRGGRDVAAVWKTVAEVVSFLVIPAGCYSPIIVIV